jgi:membrane associated rhomboid family serine protease
MNETPSIPTFQPEWHAASWFGGTLGSMLWIVIYAVVTLDETGSLLYSSLYLAAGLTVTGFAWYLWTKQVSVAYGVAMWWWGWQGLQHLLWPIWQAGLGILLPPVGGCSSSFPYLDSNSLAPLLSLIQQGPSNLCTDSRQRTSCRRRLAR